MRSIVVCPTYNERENIGPFLRAVREHLPEAAVLVVDDNSPDGTGELAEAAAAELGAIKVLHRPGKQGLGTAYRHGFDIAFAEQYDVILSMDVDFSHDPSELPRMYSHIVDGADVVIGSRYVPGGKIENWPVHRRLLSRWGNRYSSTVLRVPVRDCTSGFRAYRATALRSIEPSQTRAEGFAFLTELARRLARNECRFDEIPITFRDREHGTSKMSSRIVVESMLLVTAWAVADAARSVARTAGRVIGRTRSGRHAEADGVEVDDAHQGHHHS